VLYFDIYHILFILGLLKIIRKHNTLHVLKLISEQVQSNETLKANIGSLCLFHLHCNVCCSNGSSDQRTSCRCWLWK